MKSEIKQRIEQIKNGQVPEGYKKTKIGIVPKAWKKVKVSDFIQEYNEKTTVENQYPVLTSSRKGIMLQTDYYSNHQVTTDNNIGYNIIPRGYITYRSRSDDGNFKFNENTITDKGIVSYFYPVFSFKNNVCHAFALDTLNFTIYRRMFPYIEGTAQQVLSIKKLGNLEYYMPCLPEQEKIAEILSTQDKLIELYQRKIAELQKLKKIYLSKMFPQKGKNVPEWRFPQFTDAWEQRKLGEIADVTKLAGFEFTEHIVYSDEGNIIALRGLNVKNGRIVLDDVKYIDGSNFSKLERSKLYVDDVLFTYVGTVGELAIIPENDRFYLAPNVSRIRFRKEYFASFMVQQIGSKSFYDKMISPLIATSSQPALSMENIRKFVVHIPVDIAEQKAIGSFFRNLDNLITLHQRKLEEMKKQKKALMQLLLTGIVRVKR